MNANSDQLLSCSLRARFVLDLRARFRGARKRWIGTWHENGCGTSALIIACIFSKLHQSCMEDLSNLLHLKARIPAISDYSSNTPSPKSILTTPKAPTTPIPSHHHHRTIRPSYPNLTPKPHSHPQPHLTPHTTSQPSKPPTPSSPPPSSTSPKPRPPQNPNHPGSNAAHTSTSPRAPVRSPPLDLCLRWPSTCRFRCWTMALLVLLSCPRRICRGWLKFAFSALRLRCPSCRLSSRLFVRLGCCRRVAILGGCMSATRRPLRHL